MNRNSWILLPAPWYSLLPLSDVFQNCPPPFSGDWELRQALGDFEGRSNTTMKLLDGKSKGTATSEGRRLSFLGQLSVQPGSQEGHDCDFETLDTFACFDKLLQLLGVGTIPKKPLRTDEAQRGWRTVYRSSWDDPIQADAEPTLSAFWDI